MRFYSMLMRLAMRQLRLYSEQPREKRREKVECNVCGGIPRFCSINLCPFFRKLLNVERLREKISRSSIYGPSPPSILVGSYGYPRVRIGALVAVDREEEVKEADNPRVWITRDIEYLLAMRLSLLYGREVKPVSAARAGDKMAENMQELAMSSKPVYTELESDKRPLLRAGFLARTAPFGPVANVLQLKLTENPAVPRKIDQIAGDYDLRAADAVVELYRSGFTENEITRLMSAGVLGSKIERRLVPTEWSITAVDDILGKVLRNEVKRYPEMMRYQLHQAKALYNRVTVALIPGPWMFEVLEFWIREDRVKGPYIDAEIPMKKEIYPENVGGAYHALRLPVLEYLRGVKRQAAVITVIEIFPGWIPLGVWRFRELARRALQQEPKVFNDLEQLVKNLVASTGRYVEKALRRSSVLSFLRKQSTLKI